MGTWEPKPLERTTFFPYGTGLDSTQGFLEFANSYNRGGWVSVCDPKDAEAFHSMYFHLKQLEKEGHVVIDWKPYVSDGRELLELKQIALTTTGHKLLSELRTKSKWGKLKDRLITLVWAALTSVATTLVVLAVKGT